MTRHKPYSDHDRPLCIAAEESDREIAIRNRLTAERAQAMESALRVAGFDEGTVAWSLAVLIAKLCTGWEPLVRPLRDLADDGDINTTCAGKDRQRSVKRELDNLQAAGVLTWSRRPHKRPRGRPIVMATIRLDRRRIVERDFEPAEPAEVGGHQGGQEGGHEGGQNGGHEGGQNGGHEGGQNGGHEGGQNGGHEPAPSSYYPNTLLPSPPKADWAAAAEFLKTATDGDGSPIVRRTQTAITAAQRSGHDPADLIAAVRMARARGMGGGAVIDFLRSGDWPIDGVPPLSEIDRVEAEAAGRSARAKAIDGETAANALRSRIRRQAAARYGPIRIDDPRLLPVIARAMTAENLAEHLTAAERAAITPTEKPHA